MGGARPCLLSRHAVLSLLPGDSRGPGSGRPAPGSLNEEADVLQPFRRQGLESEWPRAHAQRGHRRHETSGSSSARAPRGGSGCAAGVSLEPGHDRPWRPCGAFLFLSRAPPRGRRPLASTSARCPARPSLRLSLSRPFSVPVSPCLGGSSAPLPRTGSPARDPIPGAPLSALFSRSLLGFRGDSPPLRGSWVPPGAWRLRVLPSLGAQGWAPRSHIGPGHQTLPGEGVTSELGMEQGQWWRARLPCGPAELSRHFPVSPGLVSGVLRPLVEICPALSLTPGVGRAAPC